jgi:hypothetical protein
MEEAILTEKKEQPAIKVEGGHPETVNAKEVKENRIAELIAAADQEIEQIKNTRSTWLDRQVRLYKQRYGLRPAKNNPWPGCSNTHIYTIDKQIKKTAPLYVNLALPNERWVQFKAPKNELMNKDMMDIADYNSELMDHLLREKMANTLNKVILATDKLLHYGFALFKVTYEYETRIKDYAIDLQELNEEKRRFLLSNPQLSMPENEKALMEFLFAEYNALGAKIELEKEDDLDQMKNAIKQFQSGKMVIKIKLNETVRKAPLLTVCKPEDVIVPGYCNEIEEAHIICHEFKLKPSDLRKLAKSGKFKANVVREILKKKPNRKNGAESSNRLRFQQAQTDLSGSSHYEVNNDLITIREVYLFGNADKELFTKKCILTYCPDYKTEDLQYIENPYEDGEWPFIKIRMDVTDNGWLHHRGIPILLDYYATLINATVNQMVDLTSLQVPMLEYVTQNVNISNIRYIPGQGIPVTALNSVREISVNSMTNINTLLERIKLFKYEIEDYTGSPDFTLTNPNNPVSEGNARTATEILSKTQASEVIFGLNAKIFLGDWHSLLKKIWSRWMQYGDAEYELAVKGAENPIRVIWKKDKVNKNLQPYPVGSAEETNPLLKSRQAAMLMDLINPTNNPVSAPMMEEYNVVKEICKMVSPSRFETFIKSTKKWEETKKMMDEQAAMQQQQALEAEKLKITTQGQFNLEQQKMKAGIDLQLKDMEGRNAATLKILEARLNAGKENKEEGVTNNGTEK